MLPASYDTMPDYYAQHIPELQFSNVEQRAVALMHSTWRDGKQASTVRAGQRRGDVEIRNYLRDQAGSRSLVFDLSIAHDSFGSSCHVQQNGLLTNSRRGLFHTNISLRTC
jgi:hypothetical protein